MLAGLLGIYFIGTFNTTLLIACIIIVGIGVATRKHVPNLANQAESALVGIRMLITFIPIGSMVIGAIVLMFFSLTGKKQK